MNAFKIGDIVCFKTTTIPMTVGEVTGKNVYCAYMHNGQLITQFLNADSLILLSEQEKQTAPVFPPISPKVGEIVYYKTGIIPMVVTNISKHFEYIDVIYTKFGEEIERTVHVSTLRY